MRKTVLKFWFGTLNEAGLADETHVKQWWQKDPAFDDQLRSTFGTLHAACSAGEHSDWLATPHGRLAYLIVLDQFSRNLGRDTAAMYANDARALPLALEGIQRGDAQHLSTDERVFLYMPLMHAEDLAAQEQCVRLFEQLADAVEGPAAERIRSNADFAEKHRVIIAEWGRFPHRNTILGRESTAAEVEFLKQPGSSF